MLRRVRRSLELANRVLISIMQGQAHTPEHIAHVIQPVDGSEEGKPVANRAEYLRYCSELRVLISKWCVRISIPQRNTRKMSTIPQPSTVHGL